MCINNNNMKKTIITFLLTLVSFWGISQTKKDEILLSTEEYLPERVSKMIKENVTFVSWKTFGDTIKVIQMSIYESKNKKFIEYNEKDIEKKYPSLTTLKTNSPLGFTVTSHVNNF